MMKMPATMRTCRKYALSSHKGIDIRKNYPRSYEDWLCLLGHPIRSLPREEPGRPEEQDHDDEEEAHRVAVARGDVARAELLDQREDEAAEGGARDAAQTPEDHDGERLRRSEVSPCSGRRRTPARAAPRPAAARPEPSAKVAVWMFADPHAHQRRGVAVLERRAHRAAQLRAVY
jgi:hypothetical protein